MLSDISVLKQTYTKNQPTKQQNKQQKKTHMNHMNYTIKTIKIYRRENILESNSIHFQSGATIKDWLHPGQEGRES